MPDNPTIPVNDDTPEEPDVPAGTLAEAYRPAEPLDVLILSVARKRYALPVDVVEGVVRAVAVTTVPDSPAGML